MPQSPPPVNSEIHFNTLAFHFRVSMLTGKQVQVMLEMAPLIDSVPFRFVVWVKSTVTTA